MIPIMGYQDQQGRRATALFTDEEALQNWDPNAFFMCMHSKQLFPLLRGPDFEYIAINPFDPIRKMLRPCGILAMDEVNQLAEGRIPDF